MIQEVNLELFMQSPRVLETSLAMFSNIFWDLQATRRGMSSIPQAYILGRHIINKTCTSDTDKTRQAGQLLRYCQFHVCATFSNSRWLQSWNAKRHKENTDTVDIIPLRFSHIYILLLLETKSIWTGLFY